MRLSLLIAVSSCLAAGCTHQALRKHTVLTAGTITEIQYQMVLSNIAMFSCHPELLPWHVRLRDGVIQVNDEGRFNAESFDSRMAFDRLGPRVARNLTEQWDVRPVINPKELASLQAAYQKLFGLPVDEELLMIEVDEEADGDAADDAEDVAPEVVKSGDGYGPSIPRSLAAASSSPGTEAVTDGDRDANNAERRKPVPEEPRRQRWNLGEDVFPGWFQVGSRKDVPKDACFVGRYGKRYAWVEPDGIPGLTKFTLVVLTITELKNDVRPARGVVFSPRGF